jgi:hypothetical protein
MEDLFPMRGYLGRRQTKDKQANDNIVVSNNNNNDDNNDNNSSNNERL